MTTRKRYDPLKGSASAARQRRLRSAQGLVELERRARAAGLPPTAKEVLWTKLRAELDDRAAEHDEPHARIRAARTA